MEDWQLDFEWLRIRHLVKDRLNLDKLPDFNQMMLLIGIQELGEIKEEFSKEEKIDLFHIATCRLMSPDGYFRFSGRDRDGWPHWEEIKQPVIEESEKEQYLTLKIIEYFDKIFHQTPDEQK